MSLSLISSAGQRPVRDWSYITVAAPADTNAHALNSGTALLVQKAEIFAPAGNAGTVTFGPSSAADFGSLAASGRYTISGQPGSVFNLATWFFKCSNGADTLRVAYQV